MNVKKFPYMMLAKALKEAAKVIINTYTPEPTPQGFGLRCRKSDDKIAIEFVYTKQARTFVAVSKSKGHHMDESYGQDI